MLAVDRQPARAFGHVTARQQHGKSKQRADEKSRTPADVDRENIGIEQQQRRERSERGADPVAAVDAKIHLAANARGNQLVDRRIDRSVFAADAEAGDDPACRHACEVPRECGRQRPG